MTSISATAVASLRARTGVSILECKKALEECGGNEEAAIDLLRKKGIAQAAKKAGREQREGIVFIASSPQKAASLTLHCETDFVARDATFQSSGTQLAQQLLNEGEEKLRDTLDQTLPTLVQKLGENISLGDVHAVEAPVIGTYIHTNGKIGVIVGLDGGTEAMARDVAMHAAAMNPQFVSPTDVPESAVAKEKEVWTEQLKKEGKPQNIIEKIMQGKEKKFREENALIKQEFVKEPGRTVEQFLGGHKVLRYIRVAIG